MKKSVLLICFSIIFDFVHAQFYPDWTSPVAITDSLSINSNPDIMPVMYNSGDDILSFSNREAKQLCKK